MTAKGAFFSAASFGSLGKTWTIGGTTRPWPFGTILRRTAKNLAEIRPTAAVAEQRVLVLSDQGAPFFTGLTIRDSRPERVGRTDDQWIAEYWEPDRA